MPDIIGVQFRENGKAYYFDPGELQVEKGATVVVENAQGIDCGTCVAANHPLPESFNRPLKRVIRLATPDDIRRDVQRVCDACADCRNFMISSGCDIPAASSWQNIDAYFEKVTELYA